MKQNVEKVTDDSNLSLSEVVKRRIGRNSSFFELDQWDQRAVLVFMKRHGIDVRVFQKKWFDILKGKFYAIEIRLTEERPYEIESEEREFETFRELFEYVHGDIYENSCFFGYEFSNSDLNEFQIDQSRLNRDSFIDFDIKQFTFEAITKAAQEKKDTKFQRGQEVVRWVERCKPIHTYKELKEKYDRFSKKFPSWVFGKVFFSLMIQKQKDLIKDAAVEFACHQDEFYGFGFDEALLTYGREEAQKIIENYDAAWTKQSNKRHIKGFRNKLEGYDSGTYVLRRRSGFRDELQLYYVEDFYSNNINAPLSTEVYFGSFEGFVTFLNGDLSGANLYDAPIDRSEVRKYKIDDRTILPRPKNYTTYQIRKKYFDGKFIVKQKWIDDDVVSLSKEHIFEHFFDFVHFLKGDLSEADLLLCDGIENLGRLKDLKLSGINVRSWVAEKLGLSLKPLPSNRFIPKGFETTNKYELQTLSNFLTEHPEDDDYSGKVSYISDIHLLHRFEAHKCKTPDDINYVIRTLAMALDGQATSVNLIAGDTSSDFGVFKAFVSSLAAYRKRGNFFFTLGNHELWGHSGANLQSIFQKYRSVIDELGGGNMYLVQNNLFYFDRRWKEIPEDQLSQMAVAELREKTRGAIAAIFGGVGFAGSNDEFNASNGIYMNALNREEEICESSKFLSLYSKVAAAFKRKNLIVLTHMPMRDWGDKDIQAEEGVVYVNGHSHRNYFCDDGKTRIYADNQVGYRGTKVAFKQVSVDFGYDWFADYQDGIYEITKEDYESFYRGLNEGLTFRRSFEKLFLIKRERAYMFLMQAIGGKRFILNGGSIRKAGNHPLEYFYENLIKYSASVNLFLSNYDRLQKQVSREVKQLGGDGRIHGCIVDIDFYNHLYINPLDGTITPYFAYSMVEKYVYDNLGSLLKFQCPKLFANYEALLSQLGENKALVNYEGNLSISKKTKYVESTEMYKVSRIIRGLQFTTKYNVVRLWNDAIVADATEENGKLIVSGIIDPDSLPRPPREHHSDPSKSKAGKAALSEEEKLRIRDEKYKSMVLEITKGNISVATYRGAKEKADYVCSSCGYSWSIRADHFKDRQKYKCPKCGAGADE